MKRKPDLILDIGVWEKEEIKMIKEHLDRIDVEYINPKPEYELICMPHSDIKKNYNFDVKISFTKDFLEFYFIQNF